MKIYLSDLVKKYKEFFSKKENVSALLNGLSLFILSLLANFYAALFAVRRASSPVSDLVLSNIPVFDVDAIFIYGPVVLWAFVVCLCLWEPKRIPFILKSIALFVLIRSVFITLTHIGPFPTRAPLDYSLDIVKMFTTGGDLFFSGHTGLPFLMALVFYRSYWLRVFFILAAVFFGVIVLLGHFHYSIDVLSAFFITYTIYHMAEKFYRKDRQLFHS